jgi:hypothetical protein
MLREAPTSTTSRLALETTLAAVHPSIVTDHSTDPGLPTTWWAGEAYIDSETGDSTHFIGRLAEGVA